MHEGLQSDPGLAGLVIGVSSTAVLGAGLVALAFAVRRNKVGRGSARRSSLRSVVAAQARAVSVTGSFLSKDGLREAGFLTGELEYPVTVLVGPDSFIASVDDGRKPELLVSSRVPNWRNLV